MAAIDQTKGANAASKAICWGRGDSDARGFIVQDSAGVAINITGFTFKLTVNSERDPTDTVNQLFTVVGVIGSPTAGTVSFAPLTTDTVTIGKFFYDIEQTDGAGLIKTIIKGKCEIVQDITKV